jgi:hypothetical protein
VSRKARLPTRRAVYVPFKSGRYRPAGCRTPPARTPRRCPAGRKHRAVGLQPRPEVAPRPEGRKRRTLVSGRVTGSPRGHCGAMGGSQPGHDRRLLLVGQLDARPRAPARTRRRRPPGPVRPSRAAPPRCRSRSRGSPTGLGAGAGAFAVAVVDVVVRALASVPGAVLLGSHLGHAATSSRSTRPQVSRVTSAATSPSTP